MHVRTYTIDGEPAAEAELTRDDSGQLRLDGEPVLAISLCGTRVILTLCHRLVTIDARSIGRLVPHIRPPYPSG